MSDVTDTIRLRGSGLDETNFGQHAGLVDAKTRVQAECIAERHKARFVIGERHSWFSCRTTDEKTIVGAVIGDLRASGLGWLVGWVESGSGCRI